MADVNVFECCSDIEKPVAIQELRHKSQESSDATKTTNTIDQSLMALDEKLEAVSKEMKFIGEAIGPLLQVSSTPTLSENGEASETAMIIRKHATMVADWESVHDERDTLREELKEDKWLTVFRTVTDQADGMMSSLEKAVNRCQVVIKQRVIPAVVILTIPIHRTSSGKSIEEMIWFRTFN